MEGSRREVSWGWTIALTPVFLLNLIVPYSIGCEIVEPGYRPGMYGGIAFYWVVGLAVSIAYPSLGRSLVRGGLIVAFTQVLPILQVLAGFGAAELAEPMDRKTMGFGFYMVVITGGFLLLGAYAIDRLCAPIWSGLDQQRNRNIDPENREQPIEDNEGIRFLN